eukprot:1362892-Pleurochrysis_carterae.AAC.1
MLGEVSKFWTQLALDSVTCENNADQTRVVRLTVNRIGPVCQAFWAKAYGISLTTSNRLFSDARAGRLHADAMWADAGDLGDVAMDDTPSSVAMEERIALVFVF